MTVIRASCLAIGLVVGIVIGSRSTPLVPVSVLLMLAGCSGLLSLIYWRDERQWRPRAAWRVAAAALIVTIPLGVWRTWQHVGPPVEGSLRAALADTRPGAVCHLKGTIVGEPELRTATRGDLRVRVEELRTDKELNWRRVRPGEVLVNVTIRAASDAGDRAAFARLMDPVAYGYSVVLESRYRPARAPLNPGEFDYAEFLLQHNTVARFRAPITKIKVRLESRGNALTEVALAAKKSFLLTYKQTIRAPASRLVAAATLGVRRAVENVSYHGSEIVASFRHAGVGHVLAVSGLHVSVVALLLYFMFRAVGLPPRVFAPILILILAAFALLTGARPSVIRAVIMNSVILIVLAYFRFNLRHATYIGLALSSLVILLGNPLVLFSPSFLLSFGAVLSLVLFAPVFDRWLCRLRGFCLLFAMLWFAGLLTVAGGNMGALLNVWNAIGCVGMLMVAILLGAALNHQFPRAWRFGLDAIPPGLRLFLGAQLAIQVGMMIPLSAWFFGQFPIAGVCINLLAIPAIGVVVQLGMLTGLFGMIPVVGETLAMPFGAAVTLVGDFFFWLAHVGTVLFPFPAVPRPSGIWMGAYYFLAMAILVADRHRIAIQSIIFRVARGLSRRRVWLYCARALPLAMAVAPVLGLIQNDEECEAVVVCAAGRYPVVAAVSKRNLGVTINAGDWYDGERTLFAVLRTYGAVTVDTAILAGPQPQAGNEGLAGLSTRMQVRRCLMPVVPPDAQRYLEAIDDDYLLRKARDGEAWAQSYVEAYAGLTRKLDERGTRTQRLVPGPAVSWRNLEISVLPGLSSLPPRFVSTARTAILHLSYNETSWLVITDALPEQLPVALGAADARYDVLVLPDMSSRRHYASMVEQAMRLARPRVVILSNTRPVDGFDSATWRRKWGAIPLLTTTEHGAITARPLSGGGVELIGHISGRRLTLRGNR